MRVVYAGVSRLEVEEVVTQTNCVKGAQSFCKKKRAICHRPEQIFKKTNGIKKEDTARL